MTTMTETYNGWKNYPTWAVNLWLSNDEGLYHATQEIVSDIMEASESGHGGRAATADALKSFVDDLLDEQAGNLGAPLASDLLGYAMDSVDWHEIADAWRSES